MKEVYLILGSIGAGKSTVASLLLSLDKFKNVEFVSADMYKKMFFNDHPDLHVNYQMARVYMKYKIEKLVTSKQSFALEMVPSKQEKFDLLRTLRDQHLYKIIAIYIGTSTAETNISRVSKRVAEGADIVKEEKTFSRHSLSLTSIKKILDLSSETYFIDNTKTCIKLIACHKEEKLYLFNKIDWFETYVLKDILGSNQN